MTEFIVVTFSTLLNIEPPGVQYLLCDTDTRHNAILQGGVEAR